jgi:hypothetical protein
MKFKVVKDYYNKFNTAYIPADSILEVKQGDNFAYYTVEDESFGDDACVSRSKFDFKLSASYLLANTGGKDPYFEVLVDDSIAADEQAAGDTALLVLQNKVKELERRLKVKEDENKYSQLWFDYIYDKLLKPTTIYKPLWQYVENGFSPYYTITTSSY